LNHNGYCCGDARSRRDQHHGDEAVGVEHHRSVPVQLITTIIEAWHPIVEGFL